MKKDAVFFAGLVSLLWVVRGLLAKLVDYPAHKRILLPWVRVDKQQFVILTPADLGCSSFAKAEELADGVFLREWSGQSLDDQVISMCSGADYEALRKIVHVERPEWVAVSETDDGGGKIISLYREGGGLCKDPQPVRGVCRQERVVFRLECA